MSTPRGGRPRSDRAHRAILEATRDLLADTGYEALTIEAIAAAAGVGRQTVYRWWSAKSAVVAEAVLAGLVDAERAAPPDTGDIAADLRTWWRETLAIMAEPRTAGLVRGLVVAAAENTGDATLLYARFTGPLRDAITARLHAEAARGRLREGAALDTIGEALIGTLLYRLLTGTAERADTVLVDLLLHGVLRE
ncbi:TetR/AcrR family transcriptional regulator [Nocardia asteroides]|uniref:TetR/AcrR family transcriptional regulator n=1 Tax=Nocardia asteroides TaxID=1824 RepID=UPI001E4C948A|nr:TetR/AcrR family transcriptional regulator [Nocardia asteroides]UGT64270.1 TetR/AcrR family transcriptional regulator [Nocardia asteroides]